MKTRPLYDRTLVNPRKDGYGGPTNDRYDRPSSGYGGPRDGFKTPHPYGGPSRYDRPSSGYGGPRDAFKPPHPYDGPSRYDGPTIEIPTLPARRPRSS